MSARSNLKASKQRVIFSSTCPLIFTRLHMRLFPYAWSYATAMRETGHPIVRPLGLAYPELGLHPAAALGGVRQDNGMAGKFVEKDGLLVLTWLHGSHELDTGFRTRRAADKDTLYAALQELISSAPAAGANSGK